VDPASNAQAMVMDKRVGVEQHVAQLNFLQSHLAKVS
jgi:hypothetical protein